MARPGRPASDRATRFPKFGTAVSLQGWHTPVAQSVAGARQPYNRVDHKYDSVHSIPLGAPRVSGSPNDTSDIHKRNTLNSSLVYLLEV